MHDGLPLVVLSCALLGCATGSGAPASDDGDNGVVVPIGAPDACTRSPCSAFDGGDGAAPPPNVPDASPAEAGGIEAGPPPTVTVTITTSTSIDLGQVYPGHMVAHAMTWGFIWLDTEALTAGYVPALGYCNPLVGQPVTNWYVVGDCNGISSITSDGTTLTVNNFNGQCGAVQNGCGGPRGVFTAFAFRVGTWDFTGNVDVALKDTGRTTDPHGRAWQVVVLDAHHYMWRACTDPACASVVLPQ